MEISVPTLLFSTSIGSFPDDSGKMVRFRNCSLLQCTTEGFPNGVLPKVRVAEILTLKIDGLTNVSGRAVYSIEMAGSGKPAIAVLADFQPIRVLTLKDFEPFFVEKK